MSGLEVGDVMNHCTLADHAFSSGKGFQLEKKWSASVQRFYIASNFKSTHGPHIGLDPRATTDSMPQR